MQAWIYYKHTSPQQLSWKLKTCYRRFFFQIYHSDRITLLFHRRVMIAKNSYPNRKFVLLSTTLMFINSFKDLILHKWGPIENTCLQIPEGKKDNWSESTRSMLACIYNLSNLRCKNIQGPRYQPFIILTLGHLILTIKTNRCVGIRGWFAITVVWLWITK